MKVQWRHLSQEEQQAYGNGCGLSARWLNVPDFIFRARCQQHDFYYERGCGATGLMQNIVNGIYYKLLADWQFFYQMFNDARVSKKPIIYATISVIYLIGVAINPIAWYAFTYGQWQTKEQILERDRISKLK